MMLVGKLTRLVAYIILFLFLTMANGFAQQLLNHSIQRVQPEALLKGVSNWRQSKRESWIGQVAKISDSEKKRIMNRAERLLDFKWPSLLAKNYLEYKENGNRTNYERVVNERRQMLANLVIAELVEKKARFLPQIVNGLWLTLEESTWVSPAHIVVQKGGVGLPNPLDSYIDLATGRIAADLATIYLLLGKEIDLISPQVGVRLLAELEKRVFKPYADREDFWWMNFQVDFVNNWNIWINTNVLKTVLLVEPNDDRLLMLLDKITRSADKFLDFYPEDGICEEGPSYWNHAGGELGLMLKMLEDVSVHEISFRDEQKIHNIGTYIRYAHIAGKRFINFADAESIQLPSVTKVWTYAELFDDPLLKSFAVQIEQLSGNQIPLGSIQEFLGYLEIMEEVRGFPAYEEEDFSHYYPSLQLAVAREKVGDHKLFFSAIGGHNGVSHNHNDVGSFMLYVDSLPVFIDIGVGTYTKDTFGPRRYELWNMQSQWHNVPLINGQQQHDGKAYKANNVNFHAMRKGFRYTVDIAASYPQVAEIDYWLRSFDFMPEKKVLAIKEQFKLRDYKAKSEVVFITPYRPIVADDRVNISIAKDLHAFIEFETKRVSVQLDSMFVVDPKIVRNWGDHVYRIRLIPHNAVLKGDINYQVKLRYP